VLSGDDVVMLDADAEAVAVTALPALDTTRNAPSHCGA
jgi:hypothetical protein